MRILNRKQFLAEPIGTVFSEYESFGNITRLSVKACVPGRMTNDFFRIDLNGDLGEPDGVEGNGGTEEWMALVDRAEKGERVGVFYDSSMRDGCFDDDAKFAVFDDDDVERLIKLLQTRKEMT